MKHFRIWASRVERLYALSAKPCKVIATCDATTRRMLVIKDVN